MGEGCVRKGILRNTYHKSYVERENDFHTGSVGPGLAMTPTGIADQKGVNRMETMQEEQMICCGQP